MFGTPGVPNGAGAPDSPLVQGYLERDEDNVTIARAPANAVPVRWCSQGPFLANWAMVNELRKFGVALSGGQAVIFHLLVRGG